jgi:hypothetical protein
MAPSGDSSNPGVGAAPVNDGVEEVIPVVGAMVLAVPPEVEEVVPVPRDDDDSNNDNAVSSSYDEDSGSDNNDNSSDDEGTLHIPFQVTPSGIHWFKCLICLGEEYDASIKVVLHAFDFIANNMIAPDMVEQHRSGQGISGLKSFVARELFL